MPYNSAPTSGSRWSASSRSTSPISRSASPPLTWQCCLSVDPKMLHPSDRKDTNDAAGSISSTTHPEI